MVQRRKRLGNEVADLLNQYPSMLGDPQICRDVIGRRCGDVVGQVVAEMAARGMLRPATRNPGRTDDP